LCLVASTVRGPGGGLRRSTSDARAAATPVEQALRPKSFSDLRAAGVSVKTPEWVPKLVAADFAYSREIEKEIDCWCAKYAAETFLSLLPGAVVYENGIMRADNIEIECGASEMHMRKHADQ